MKYDAVLYKSDVLLPFNIPQFLIHSKLTLAFESTLALRSLNLSAEPKDNIRLASRILRWKSDGRIEERGYFENSCGRSVGRFGSILNSPRHVRWTIDASYWPSFR